MLIYHLPAHKSFPLTPLKIQLQRCLKTSPQNDHRLAEGLEKKKKECCLFLPGNLRESSGKDCSGQLRDPAASEARGATVPRIHGPVPTLR